MTCRVLDLAKTGKKGMALSKAFRGHNSTDAWNDTLREEAFFPTTHALRLRVT